MGAFVKVLDTKFTDFVTWVKRNLARTSQVKTSIAFAKQQIVRVKSGEDEPLVIVIFNDEKDVTDITVLNLDGTPFVGDIA